jgi:hypothetical protein
MADKKTKTVIGPITDYLASKMDEAVADEKASEKEGDKSLSRAAKNAGKAVAGMGALFTAPGGMLYNKITTGKAFKDEENEPVKKAKGGKVSSASKRADGCAIRGKTRA